MPQTKTAEQTTRALIAGVLDWADAHAGFETVVAGLAPELRGEVPQGLPYSPWQLLEHLRLTQHDILEFCRNPAYEEMSWPDDYWPRSSGPSSDRAWEASIAEFRRDREALKQLAMDDSIDLLDKVPAGTGQTYLRELLLTADHTAYHLGEMVVVRRALGAWPDHK